MKVGDEVVFTENIAGNIERYNGKIIQVDDAKEKFLVELEGWLEPEWFDFEELDKDE